MTAVATRLETHRLPRALHPVAWWVWALGLAAAASRTTNPLLLRARSSPSLGVGRGRRGAPTRRGRARSGTTSSLGAGRASRSGSCSGSLFGGGARAGDHVLFRLPHVPLPRWYAGVQLGGPVSLEALLAGADDGLRLGDLLCCVGAANALANPKRALRVLPGALYELGIAVVVALTRRAAAGRERAAGAPGPPAARRAGGRGLRALRGIADAGARGRPGPLAAPGRGDGLARLRPRRHGHARHPPAAPAALLLGGLLGLCVGAYGLLDATAPAAARAADAARRARSLCCAGLALGGRRVRAHELPARPVAAGRVGRRRLRRRAPRSLLLLARGSDPAALNPPCSPAAAGRRCRCCPRWPSCSRAAAGSRRRRSAAAAPAARHRASRWRRDRLRPGHASPTPAPTRPVLRDVDLHIDEGELCLVVGRTGAGKSTLLGAVNGLVPHFTGGTLAGASRSTAATPRTTRRASWPTWSASSGRTRWPASSPTPSRRSSPTAWSSWPCRRR